jgi:hypothetical protein
MPVNKPRKPRQYLPEATWTLTILIGPLPILPDAT